MENEDKLKNINVTTYTDEMVKALENDKGGLIKKIIHEEEEHEAERKELSPDSKKNRIFMFVSVLLVGLALTFLVILAFFEEEISTVPVSSQFTSLIFTDKTDFKAIDGLSKEKMMDLIFSQAQNTKVKIGGIEGMYLTEGQKVVGFKKLNTLLKTELTTEQTNLISDNFLLGLFKSGLDSTSPTKGDLFMLLKVRSFTDIFPVMKTWERKMLYNLCGFWGIKISPETNYLFTKDFEDGIVGNKNARILKDKDGNIVLMYVFINDSSLLITNSELASNEVILRLSSSQIKK